ncbi:MAG: hypothetical protein V4502_04550 [Pseudomonadota bacterium]
MRKLILLAGAAFVAATGPVIAKPGGHANAQATTPHAMKAHSTIHSARGVKPAKVRAVKVAKTTRLDRNHNGIADADEALARKYGGALCPPGLYKKTPSCMPPGQAKRLFRSGQRVPTGYKYYTPYSNIPQPLIGQYDLTDQYRYIYRNNVIYVVDPATSLVTRIINAVL